jgi:hypothetical protein
VGCYSNKILWGDILLTLSIPFFGVVFGVASYFFSRSNAKVTVVVISILIITKVVMFGVAQANYADSLSILTDFTTKFSSELYQYRFGSRAIRDPHSEGLAHRLILYLVCYSRDCNDSWTLYLDRKQ